ncbi:hypothetical protein [Blastochloris sulfoviridis]|uniref:Uncharacterized protein n=1 Tax=Blastochloris sulfoviridis TaxID=50712 RepID=A0A5M6HGV3_9HYPH|nr:hypothetical protein [Blastochloris sulfoviridis]KAA5595093.1 hypothetical protein F1193_16790 [Blastochloris sulfoviridis]
MICVQLIEIVTLPTGVWLTFWDLNNCNQISMEIRNASHPYRVGEVFLLDRTEKREVSALVPARREDIGNARLLVPLPESASVIKSKRPNNKTSSDVLSVIDGRVAAR